MEYIIDTIIKTIDADKGEIYITKNNNRYLLANAKIKIEISKTKNTVEKLNQMLVSFRDYHMAIMFCGDIKYMQPVSEEMLKSISQYEVVADIPKRNGTYERVIFNKLAEVDIDLEEEWKFEIRDREIIKKLLSNEY